MITLNDYLYSGDTVFRIIQNYKNALRKEAFQTGNDIDLIHAHFLHSIADLLEHNDFLTAQSQTIRQFYLYMVKEYPFLAFTFKGRIKSLIRAESKFNGYIVEYIYDYYQKHHEFPSDDDIGAQLVRFRDLIAYRIVISVPNCHVKDLRQKEELQLQYLYEIANRLPAFLSKCGFTPEPTDEDTLPVSPRLSEDVRQYYKDYIHNPSAYGYQSLHITFYDNAAHCFTEVQLRTKEMDDYAEIGPANHLGYEERQKDERARRDAIPVGECIYFDEAYERGMLLQQLELKDLDVNMFAAANNSLINDGCGLYRGRLILPFEHLSKFQSE